MTGVTVAIVNEKEDDAEKLIYVVSVEKLTSVNKNLNRTVYGSIQVYPKIIYIIFVVNAFHHYKKIA